MESEKNSIKGIVWYFRTLIYLAESQVTTENIVTTLISVIQCEDGNP